MELSINKTKPNGKMSGRDILQTNFGSREKLGQKLKRKPKHVIIINAFSCFFDVVAGCLLAVFYYKFEECAHELFLKTTILPHMCTG